MQSLRISFECWPRARRALFGLAIGPFIATSFACTGDVGSGTANPGDDPNNPENPVIEMPGVGGSGGDAVGGAGGDGGAGGTSSTPGEAVAESGNFLPLSGDQFRHAMIDLFQTDVRLGPIAPSAKGASGYAEGVPITRQEMESFIDLSGEVMDATIGKLAGWFPCHSTGDDACVEDIIGKVVDRAYRRLPTEAEKDELKALFKVARDELEMDFIPAIAVMLRGVIVSPEFLYRKPDVEGGLTGDGVAKLTAHGLAGRISFFLWDSVPDRELLNAAADGSLMEPSVRRQQVTRMLADPRAERAIDSFTRYWLKIFDFEQEQKASNFETFPALQAQMLNETTSYFKSAILSDEFGFEDLMTATASYGSRELAKHYDAQFKNVFGQDGGDITHEAQRRAGFLTHASVLASGARQEYASPTQRGVLILEQLLCTHPPPPDPDAVTDPGTPSESTTVRELYEMHASVESCKACHALFDPLGFAFGHYDAVGQYQEKDNGAEIDATGKIITLAGAPEFNGAIELVNKLSTSETVHSCFARHLNRFALGRVNSKESEKALGALIAQKSMQGASIKDLIAEIVLSKSFSEMERTLRGE